jgi:hypothetical protein
MLTVNSSSVSVRVRAGFAHANQTVAACLIPTLLAIVLALAASKAQAEVVFTNLHSFGVFTNGESPSAALVQGIDGYFYGTTSGCAISAAHTAMARCSKSAPTGG